MICFFLARGKVRCHIEPKIAVENTQGGDPLFAHRLREPEEEENRRKRRSFPAERSFSEDSAQSADEAE